MAAQADRPFLASETPFFLQPDVSESITQLAQSDRIVIFAGAGVTVDQTGLGWGDLIKTLLTDRDLITEAAMSEELAAEAIASLRPIEVATILKELHVRRTGEQGKQFVASAISKKLYAYQPWLDGALASSVVELAIEYVRCGAEVTIATTNYETILEDKFEYHGKVIGESPAVVISVQGTEVESRPGTMQSGSVTIEYLHGRVARDGSVKGDVALDELDYFNIRPLVASVLAPLFTDADILIVGSSMTDPPLLSALWTTRSDENERRRLALMAVPALNLRTPSVGQVASVASLMQTRMSAYAVELLMPDFFSQVAQYCREIASAARTARDLRVGGPTDELPYMARLDEWWKAWSRYEDCVTDAHEIIVGALKNIRDELASPGHTGSTVREVLRLEVWVRLDPAGDSRAMTLWSTSAGILTDSSVRRVVPLSNSTGVAAVDAFTTGKPVTKYLEPEQTASRRDEWLTFISCPVWVDVSGGKVPIGAVTLASRAGRKTTRIDPDWANRMSGVLNIMNTVGTQLLGVEATWVSRPESTNPA